MSLGYIRNIGQMTGKCGFQFNNENNNGGSGILEKFIFPALGAAVGTAGAIYVACRLSKKLGVSTSNADTAQKAKEGFAKNHPGFEKAESTRHTGEDAEESVDKENQPFLLLNRFVKSGEVSAFVSGPGVGKTFLACEFAKNPLLKKVVYFALDDRGHGQIKRLKSVPSIVPVTGMEFDQYHNDMKNLANDDCASRAFLDIAIKPFKQFMDRKQKLAKELGVADTVKIDKMAFFEVLVESKLCEDADAIILDSLNALVDYEYNINRPYLNRLMDFCHKTGKTMIILHHTNKKGQPAGNSAFLQVVDFALMLTKLKGTLREISVIKGRFQKEGESCVVEMVRVSEHIAQFVLRDEPTQSDEPRLTPLAKAVLEAIGDKPSITFRELVEGLRQSYNAASVKKALKDLEEIRYVSKADGKTWKTIQVSLPSQAQPA